MYKYLTWLSGDSCVVVSIRIPTWELRKKDKENKLSTRHRLVSDGVRIWMQDMRFQIPYSLCYGEWKSRMAVNLCPRRSSPTKCIAHSHLSDSFVPFRVCFSAPSPCYALDRPVITTRLIGNILWGVTFSFHCAIWIIYSYKRETVFSYFDFEPGLTPSSATFWPWSSYWPL